MKNYQVLSGSTVGTTHQKLNYNNQDSYELIQTSNYIIGVIADGCGSGHKSEVGAHLGANFACKFISKCIEENKDWQKLQ